MSIARLKELILQSENQNFIQDNLTASIPKLLFKFQEDTDKRLLVEQIASRQRIRKKLPEWYNNFKLIFPPRLNLEQSSSEATAKLKSRYLQGYTFCDLSGGLGVDFYHIAKKFTYATYVEPAAELYPLAEHNFEALNLEWQGRCTTAEAALKGLPKQDLIYLDPSRRTEEKLRVINLDDYSPDVLDLETTLLAKAKQVLIKVSPMLDLQAAISQLKSIAEIWIISVKNECKEMLLLLRERQDPDVKIHTWNLADSEEYFAGNMSQQSALPEIGEPQQFLYEPNSSIMKGRLADALALKFGLIKLHTHSNFFTSQKLHSDYPGKKFRVIELHKPFNKSLKKKRLNVISRNFPQKASEIEQKMRLKPSNKDFLIATKTKSSLVFIEAQQQK